MRGSNYHDFQMLLEKRFSAGMHTAVIYTFSRAEAQDFYYNEFDSRPSWRPNSLNRPHRFRLERYFRAKRAVSTSRRGWQLSWMCQYQSGPTTEWANPFFYGNIDQVADVLNHDDAHSRDVHLWFDPNAA